VKNPVLNGCTETIYQPSRDSSLSHQNDMEYGVPFLSFRTEAKPEREIFDRNKINISPLRAEDLKDFIYIIDFSPTLSLRFEMTMFSP